MLPESFSTNDQNNGILETFTDSMNTQNGFDGLGIAPGLLATIARLRFREPTPIQQKAIPPAIEGKDVIGIAQTGTGKTLAFGVPMLQRLAQTKGRGLVILPTRELAMQVDVMLHQFGKPIGLRTAVLIGGASMSNQIQALGKKPHVVIATPGRLIDHLQHRTITLNDVKILVLDEADRMLDMGFAPQIKQILAAVPPAQQRQTMLFSATMPDAIVTIARHEMRLPIRIEMAPTGTAAEKVEQEVFIVTKAEKPRLLEKVLADTRGAILVFMRTKFTAKKLTRLVQRMGYSAAEIHSNRSLSQRRDALEGFKSGKYRVLIATDIAARGIDVKGIEVVVNYDLPMNTEDYVHRIGRTGRAGLSGRAVSFAMPDQRADLRAIERLIRRTIKVSTLPALPPMRSQPAEPILPMRRSPMHAAPAHHAAGFRRQRGRFSERPEMRGGARGGARGRGRKRHRGARQRDTSYRPVGLP